MLRAALKIAMTAAALAAIGTAVAQSKGAAAPAAQTVKIAYLDPLSGPFAAVGQNILRHFQVAAEMAEDPNYAEVLLDKPAVAGVNAVTATTMSIRMTAKTATFVDFPGAAKWLMIAGMLLGRIALVAVFVMVLPRFWRA